MAMYFFIAASLIAAVVFIFVAAILIALEIF